MKKTTALISVLLALLMLASCLFAACGKKETTTDNTTKDTNTAQTDTADNTEKTDTDTDKTPRTKGLKKIGTLDDFDSTSTYALYYEDDATDKQGLLSFEGKKLTDAEYVKISSEGKYFIVTTKAPENEDDLDGINSDGLIDANGKEIIPAKYAVIELLNDRYAQVCEGTGRTDNKDEMLFYMYSGFFSMSPSDGDPLYVGNWYIYDLTTGKPVPGIQGTNAYRIHAYGNVIEYVTDNKEYAYANEKGQALDKHDYFDNGCYAEPSGNDYIVYDSTGKELFKCASDGFVAIDSEGEFFLARKSVNSNSTYVLMDAAGKTVSPEFASRPYIDGNYVKTDEALYDLSGNKILDEEVNSLYFSNRGIGFIATTDDEAVLLDADGKEIFRVKDDDDTVSTWNSYLVASRKESDDSYTFYCWADQDFTIQKANPEDDGLVSVRAENGTYTLIDTVTGEELLSGYERYSCTGNEEDGLFIYAENAEEKYDIYRLG